MGRGVERLASLPNAEWALCPMCEGEGKLRHRKLPAMRVERRLFSEFRGLATGGRR